MGVRFFVDHANIVSYLTISGAEVPETPGTLLDEFLRALHEPADHWLISRHGEWIERLRMAAGASLEALETRGDARSERALAPERFVRVTEQLKPLFEGYGLYALLVPSLTTGERDQRVRAAAENLARESDGSLVLLPEPRGETLRVPERSGLLPAFAAVARLDPSKPGVVLWTPRATAVALTGEEAYWALRNLTVRDPRARPITSDAALVEDVLATHRPRDERRLVQLSDLHFGAKFAKQNEAMLQAELEDCVGQVDRVVITGDLLDSPTHSALQDYERFRMYLERMSKAPVVQIPGNHDVRMSGNFLDIRRQASRVPHVPVVIDDDAEAIFVCFDSTEKGSFARGGIPVPQLTRRGAELRGAISNGARRAQGSNGRDVYSYVRLALVHHHPFSFETPPKTLLQRGLALLGLTDEPFLAMMNAEQFLAWCADWEVSAILHGHKHVPRYLCQPVTSARGTKGVLTSIGCGSSLGAEGSPISYNILTWDAYRRSWFLSVFESVRGGPFLPKRVTVTQHVPQVLSLP